MGIDAWGVLTQDGMCCRVTWPDTHMGRGAYTLRTAMDCILSMKGMEANACSLGVFLR